jgi:uncharacterized protein
MNTPNTGAPMTDRGNWMQTYTGRAFYPLHPDPADVDPADIAHALSNICRYGGHVRRYYSVAEHCVLLSYAVAPQHALWALLHDATEAYVGDMIRPLKRTMPDYVTAENRIMRAICERFGLPYDCPSAVKTADSRILLDERNAVLGPCPMPWPDYLEKLAPLGVHISAWTPARAERSYLARFAELRDQQNPGTEPRRTSTTPEGSRP